MKTNSKAEIKKASKNPSKIAERLTSSNLIRIYNDVSQRETSVTILRKRVSRISKIGMKQFSFTHNRVQLRIFRLRWEPTFLNYSPLNCAIEFHIKKCFIVVKHTTFCTTSIKIRYECRSFDSQHSLHCHRSLRSFL